MTDDQNPFTDLERAIAMRSAIRRLNGAGDLRRSASIRNSCSAGPRARITAAENPEYGFNSARTSFQSWPPGTELLDAETGRQKSSAKFVNAFREQNPRNEWSEIPAETRYLASCRKRGVCKDWMVGATGI